MFAALLLSTLGVQLPMHPFLDDTHAHGRRAFLRAAAPAALGDPCRSGGDSSESSDAFARVVAELAQPANLGRDGRAVARRALGADAFRRLLGGGGGTGRGGGGGGGEAAAALAAAAPEELFIFEGITPRQLANAAVRKKEARYRVARSGEVASTPWQRREASAAAGG